MANKPLWQRIVDPVIDGALKRIGRGGAGVDVLFGGENPKSPMLGFADWSQEKRERLAVTSSWVYSAINLLANKASAANLGVFEQDRESLTEIVDHPFEQIWQRPHRFFGTSFLMQYTIWWLRLRGEAYWWLIPDRAGELASMVPVPSSHMQPVPDSEEYIRGYAYWSGEQNKWVPIPADKVCYFRLPNPFDFHRGLSPLSAYRTALETDTAASRWNRDTFVKEATLRTLFSLPADLQKQVFDRAKDEILREVVQEHKRFMVVRAGQVDVKTMGLSQKDAEFLAGREFSREEIDRVVGGIPAGYWAKDATRANAEAAEMKVTNDSVWPMLVMMHDEITTQIVQPNYGENMVARFEDIRVQDRRLVVVERNQAQTTQTINEARAARGDGPYEGPMADTLGDLLVPLATNPQFAAALAGVAVALPGGGGGTLPPSKAIRDELRTWRRLARKRAGEGKALAAVGFDSDVIPANLKALVQGALERFGCDKAFRFLKQMEPVTDEAEAELISLVMEVFQRFGNTASADIRAGRDFDFSALSVALRFAIEPFLAQTATEAALRIMTETRLEFDPAVINTAAANWAETYSFELVSGLTETTRNVVSGAVKKFIETPGMTREQLEALLRPAFGGARAEMIAVTEVTRAFSQATLQYSNLIEVETGIIMEGVWNTRADELVCPICGPLNGKRDSLWSDEFPEGPPAHVNCRCFTTLRRKAEQGR